MGAFLGSGRFRVWRFGLGFAGVRVSGVGFRADGFRFSCFGRRVLGIRLHSLVIGAGRGV